MITVTPEAIDLIKQSKDSQNIKDEVGVRLTALPDGEFGPTYDIRFDLPSETDVKIGPEGSQLFVTPATMQIMQGATFDAVETPKGTAFKVINPDDAAPSAGSSCGSGGCGSGGCGSQSAPEDTGISGEAEESSAGGCGSGCGCR